jgi:hypothetical protein
MLVMDYIQGPEHTVDAICRGGRFVLGHAKTREAVRAGLAMFFQTVDEDQLVEGSRALVRELAIDWFVNLQFIGGRLLEINPRISTIVYQEDLNLPYLAVRHAVGEIDEEGAAMSRGYAPRVRSATTTSLSTTMDDPPGEGRVLIISWLPSAGGSGVQRVLKLCKHLPEFGWQVEVLAPDDLKWVAHDPDLAASARADNHRARIPRAVTRTQQQRPLGRAQGWRGLGTRGAVLGRKMLVDAACCGRPALPGRRVRIVRERKIDLILTSSPSSVHIVGSYVTRRTGITKSPTPGLMAGESHRCYERRTVQAKRKLLEQIAHHTLKPAAD